MPLFKKKKEKEDAKLYKTCALCGKKTFIEKMYVLTVTDRDGNVISTNDVCHHCMQYISN